MAIECRILRNEYGEIDHVIANNGERSELFDNLVEMTGGNKDAALDLYALTDTEEFKELSELKSNEEKTKFLKDFQKKKAVASSIEDIVYNQDKEYFNTLAPLQEDFQNMLEEVKKVKEASKKAYTSGDSKKGQKIEKEALKITTDFQDKYGLGIRLGAISGRNSTPEPLSSFRGSRGTGHFGTGFYFTGIQEGDIKEAMSNNISGKNLTRTTVVVDFSKYNLLRVRDNQEGYELHEALKSFAGGAQISEDTDFKKDLYKEILNSEGDENGMFEKILEETYSAAIASLGAGKFNEEFVANIEDFDRGDEVSWLEGSGKSNFIERLSRAIINTLRSEIDYYTEKKDVSSIAPELPNSFDNNIKNIIEEIGAIPTDLVSKQKYFLNSYNAKLERLAKAIAAIDSSRNVEEVYKKIKELYSKIYEEYDPYSDKADKQTTIGTQLIKELGYNGIDVRGVGENAGMTAMDNFSFGSVIYDMDNTKDGTKPVIKEFFGADNKPKFSKNQGEQAPREVLNQVTDRLKESGLANNVYQMTNDEIEAKLIELGESNVEKNTAGFTYKGDVYLNSEVETLNTSIHEFGHLHLDWLKENRNDLYKSGLTLIDSNKEEAKQYIDIVKETQPDLVEGSEKFINEVLAQVIGDQGTRLINSKKEGSIADWLKSVWEAIRDVLGLSSYTAEQVANMTLEEFGTASASEMLSGNRISRNIGENNVYLRYKYDVNQVARERFNIPSLKEISSGSDRVVFDLGEGKVLKVANTARGLAQNMQEGDPQLIEKGLIPQVYETGLNYVVVERVQEVNDTTKIPVYNLEGKQYDTESLGTMIVELSDYRQADFDVKDQNLIDILKSYGLGAMADYDILFADLLNIANWGMKDNKLIHLDAGTFGGMYMIRQYARRKDMSFQDFENVYNKTQEAKAKFGDTDSNINFSIVAGNKLFNEPLEDASVIANEYMAEKGMSTNPIQKITKLDVDNSKKIAQEFDKMEATPKDPKTKEAYKSMVDETLEQYEKILSKGYKVEINNSEPYDSSADMIKDLRDNKRMKIFSTESGFGDEDITDKQREENPLLQETKYKDVNGLPLLANDVFRFVHDFFGHAKFGNGFGAIGEENAWNIHARMYSPLARRAMTTETRGQNSWVNFSGVNDEVFKKRDEARRLRQQGKSEEAKKLTEEVYTDMSFAEQKIGLLPEWVSIPKGENISPENSSNYANLTEDGEGNFVFYHLGKSGYDVIKKNSGSTLATSREEAQALSKVGGLAMYYTKPEDSETMVSGDSKYMVKIPINKVYDFNTDSLNLIVKAKELHNIDHPNKSFDANTQVAYVTKVAAELGYDMVVAEWGDKTRAQSTKEFRPTDVEVREGNTVKKPFNENYESNLKKGYKSIVPVSKDSQLESLYLELNDYRNKENNYDKVYKLYGEFAKLSQDEISDRINNSNLPEEYKSRYNDILRSSEGKRMSETTTQSVKPEPTVEFGSAKVFSKDRINPITGESTGEIELQLIETEELYRGKGQGRAALKKFLEYTDAASKNVYLAVNPRDGKTKFTKLVDFYKSEGFKMEPTGFEMIRKAKPLMPANFDVNGEADLKTVLDFSNRSSDGLTSEEKVEAINFMLSTGLKSSTELLSKLEDTFFKNGIFIPNKIRMAKSGLYNKFEISEIIQSPILQKEIKELVLALRNTEEISVEYDGKFISGENTSLNNFGKQTVANPYILEKEIATEIAELPLENVKESLSSDIAAKYKNDADFKKTVDRIATDHRLANIKRIDNGELVDKISDTSGKLQVTLIKDLDQELFSKLDYLLNSISENVWNQNLDLVSKSIENISELAKQNGVDFSNLSTKVYSIPRQEVVTLLNSFAELVVSEDNANLTEFADLYDNMFDITQPQKELIKTDSEFDVVLDSELSEQELFYSHNLVKKAEGVYRKIEPTTLEDLYDSFFSYKNLFPSSVKDIEQLKSHVQEKSVVDVENGFSLEEGDMEKMWMYKKFFNFPINISKEKVEVERTKDITMDSEYLMGDFVKDFNVYLLESGNKYFKVTERGIELENNDPISKQEAKLSLSEDLTEALAQYDAISRHLNLGLESQSDNYDDFKSENVERVNAVNNPDSVPKLSGEYTYIEEGILVAKNEANMFVRTPVGVFELVYEMNNIKFFNKLPSADANYKIYDLEKPLTNVDFNNHFYLQNSVDVFKEAKKSYTKKELEKINKDYFGC